METVDTHEPIKKDNVINYPHQLIMGTMDPAKPMLCIVARLLYARQCGTRIKLDTVKTIAKLAQKVKDVYSSRYNIFVTTDECEIIGPNVVQLIVDPSTDFDQLFKQLDMLAENMKENKED